MNGEVRSERQLVRYLEELFKKDKPSFLRKIFIHTNLSTKRFRQVWSEWWQGEAPPRLEVDMVPVFEDGEKILIPGIEVEYFKDKSKNFTDGLQQVVSFGPFGFDSLVLWHIFSEKMDNLDIEGYTRSMKEMVEGFNLPIVYFATKMVGEGRFEFFAPWKLYSSAGIEPGHLLRLLRDDCEKKRNPLLGKENVEKARKMLKLMLKIPV